MDLPDTVDHARAQLARLTEKTHVYSSTHSRALGQPAGICGSKSDRVHSWHEIKRNAVTCKSCLALWIKDQAGKYI